GGGRDTFAHRRFFVSSRRRHTSSKRDWSSDVCSSDLPAIPASPPEPLRTPAPAAQTRSEAILDGAARLFAERGYHGSSLRDISREVGISHPGMLHHFASKDALLSAVIDRMEDHAQGLL